MSANYKQLTEFQKKIEKLNGQQKEQFLQSCCKELAARLLAKVVKRTPVGGYYTDKFGDKQKIKGYVGAGTLRRGWTAGKSATNYANSLNIQKVGGMYHIDIVNPVEYASYVEYGHRTRNHEGWVDGHHMLSISEAEIRNSSDRILMAKLNKFMKDVFEL